MEEKKYTEADLRKALEDFLTKAKELSFLDNYGVELVAIVALEELLNENAQSTGV